MFYKPVPAWDFSSNALAAAGGDQAQQDGRVRNHFPQLKANGSNRLDVNEHFKMQCWDFAMC